MRDPSAVRSLLRWLGEVISPGGAINNIFEEGFVPLQASFQLGVWDLLSSSLLCNPEHALRVSTFYSRKVDVIELGRGVQSKMELEQGNADYSKHVDRYRLI